MNEYVADTHSLLWYLTNSPLLGRRASAAFDNGEKGIAHIHIPVIVIAELYYLNIKWNYIKDFASELRKLIQSGQFVFVPFEVRDVLEFDNDLMIREMHDRMIVGVARRLGAPLITKDRAIIASKTVETLW